LTRSFSAAYAIFPSIIIILNTVTTQSDSIEWFLLLTGQFGYPQPEADFGYLNFSYDQSQGCPTCGIDVIQDRPLRFRQEPKAKHSHFIGLNWIFDQIFVLPAVKEVLITNNITGVRFSQPVIHRTNEPVQGIFQLHVDTLLPPGVIPDTLTTEKCELPRDRDSVNFLRAIKSKLLDGPFCGRIKYNFPLGTALKAKREIFAGMPDIVRVSEWFGSGGSASRPILVSKKVETLVAAQKWRGANLDPIQLV
jgi:hypothetical protein